MTHLGSLSWLPGRFHWKHHDVTSMCTVHQAKGRLLLEEPALRRHCSRYGHSTTRRRISKGEGQYSVQDLAAQCSSLIESALGVRSAAGVCASAGSRVTVMRAAPSWWTRCCVIAVSGQRLAQRGARPAGVPAMGSLARAGFGAGLFGPLQNGGHGDGHDGEDLRPFRIEPREGTGQHIQGGGRVLHRARTPPRRVGVVGQGACTPRRRPVRPAPPHRPAGRRKPASCPVPESRSCEVVHADHMMTSMIGGHAPGARPAPVTGR